MTKRIAVVEIEYDDRESDHPSIWMADWLMEKLEDDDISDIHVMKVCDRHSAWRIENNPSHLAWREGGTSQT